MLDPLLLFLGNSRPICLQCRWQDNESGAGTGAGMGAAAVVVALEVEVVL